MNSTIVITDNYKNALESNLNIKLNTKQINFYNPILDNLVDKNECNNVIYKSKYFISELLENTTKNTESQDTPYIKRNFNAKIINNYTKKYINKEIFIKVNPILDVVSYILDEYDTKNTLFPNYISNYTSNYINNYNNTAYIDSFFSFIASKMVETGKAPCFPLFYGTCSALLDEYKYDITEEYSKIKYNNMFQKNLDNIFTIDEIDIKNSDSEYDSDSESNSSTETESLEELNKFTQHNINNNELINIDNIEDILNSNNEFDNIDNNYVGECRAGVVNENLTKENLIGENSIEETNLKSVLNIKSIDNSCDFSDIIDNNDTFKYCILNNFPTQLLFMEKLEYTLDELIENKEYNISTTEWKSILFQICFGLSIAQKHYKFVHNDLHSQNIMFVTTNDEYIFYEYNSKYFRIPTFGKIVKIIDYGRATFEFNKTIYFSSVFDDSGDAEGQYDYPENNSYDNCKHKPNYSFDLARLSTTIIEYFEKNNCIYKLLKGWLIDKYGKNLENHEDNFNLYIKIAKNITNAVPKKQLTKVIFKEFLITKNSINKKNYIFKY